ncbi:hypothetical protein SRABI80_01660 [Peribacillus frigoritolerans]|nr:hypothetical protein SRABI80_01660 [Peribacillus frigoritolerans]
MAVKYCVLTYPVFPLAVTLDQPLDSEYTVTVVLFTSLAIIEAEADAAERIFRLEPSLTFTYLTNVFASPSGFSPGTEPGFVADRYFVLT